MMERISDERLAKLARLTCAAAHWETSECHICERREMAVELQQRRDALASAEEIARRAFVCGAKWWEWEKTGATIWPSDQARASEAAPRHLRERTEP